MQGWQANLKRIYAKPVVLGLCPKLKNPPLCGGIFIYITDKLIYSYSFHSSDKSESSSLSRSVTLLLYMRQNKDNAAKQRTKIGIAIIIKVAKEASIDL